MSTAGYVAAVLAKAEAGGIRAAELAAAPGYWTSWASPGPSL